MSHVLAGRTALITGSTQGLGLAAARRFAAAGCNVVLNGLGDAGTGGALAAELERDHGIRAIHDGADLRNPGEIARMMAGAVTSFGAVDVLVNNAAVRHQAPVDAFLVEDWDEAIAVNLSAAFHAIRLALPGMRQRNWGRIINVSSIYGLRAAPNRIGYVTSKTGLLGLTRAVAVEAAPHGITCNAICPGTAETPVHERALRALMADERLPRPEAERRLLEHKQPSRRLVSPDAVAALMVFLCGPDGRDITGAALPIDGGWSSV